MHEEVVCKGCNSRMVATSMATGSPSCPTCIGDPNNSIPIGIDVPDEALCTYCKQRAYYTNSLWYIDQKDIKERGKEGIRSPSGFDYLPFFGYDQKKSTAYWYCGCMGWD